MFIKVGSPTEQKSAVPTTTQYSEQVSVRQTPRMYKQGLVRTTPILATGLKLNEYFRVSMNYGIRPKIAAAAAWTAPSLFLHVFCSSIFFCNFHFSSAFLRILGYSWKSNYY